MYRIGIKRNFFSGMLFQNLSNVLKGTLVAQLIIFISSPIITRLYSPESFGIQGSFLALISILSPLVAMRYPMAIVVSENESEIDQLVWLSILVSFIVSLFFFVLFFLFSTDILVLIGLNNLGAFVFLIPISLFFVGLQDIMNFRSAKLNEFSLYGKVTAIQAFFANLARVIGGLIFATSTTLILATMGSIIGQASLLRLGLRSRIKFAKPEWSKIYQLGKKHYEFPVFRAPADLVNAISQSLPVLLLLALFNPAIAGYYTLGRGVLNLPLNIIGSSIGTVLYARIAEIERQKSRLLPFVVQATLLLIIGPGSCIILISLTFPQTFQIVFGDEWRTAGVYAQWMSIWLIFALSNIPSVRTLPVIKKQKLHLIFNILIMICGLSGMLIGNFMFNTALANIIGFSIATMFCYLIQISAYLYVIWKFDERR